MLVVQWNALVSISVALYPVSKKGHRYLMVVSCYFTKWVDAIPLNSQEAKNVTSKLLNRFISIYGVPLKLHTDLG